MSEKKLLKNCPFCGGNNVISTWNNFRPELLCGGCGATMIVPIDIRGGDYEEELITKWNTRKPMERIMERLEDVRLLSLQNACIKDAGPECYNVYCETCYMDRAIEIVKEEGGLNEDIKLFKMCD